MIEAAVEHDLTLWMKDDIPIRLFYAGRRWRVTDTPTRLRDSIWDAAAGARGRLYGWRFQASDEAGESFVFDVHRDDDGWRVHHFYA